jgi:hypothetical protein
MICATSHVSQPPHTFPDRTNLTTSSLPSRGSFQAACHRVVTPEAEVKLTAVNLSAKGSHRRAKQNTSQTPKTGSFLLWLGGHPISANGSICGDQCRQDKGALAFGRLIALIALTNTALGSIAPRHFSAHAQSVEKAAESYQ